MGRYLWQVREGLKVSTGSGNMEVMSDCCQSSLCGVRVEGVAPPRDEEVIRSKEVEAAQLVNGFVFVGIPLSPQKEQLFSCKTEVAMDQMI